MSPSSLASRNQLIAASVREINVLVALLASRDCMDAASEGDATSILDAEAFSRAWEGCSTFRDQMLMCLARNQRDHWRRDVQDIMENEPAEHQAVAVAEALDLRLRCALDLAFRFLTPRQMCFLADALLLSFSADMPNSEVILAMGRSAGRSKLATQPMLDAMVFGKSGTYQLQPERVLALTAH